MADRFIVEHVQRLPMFSTLPPDLLNALAEAFVTTRYERGELIFQQGDPSKGLYLLVTGRGALWQYINGTMQQIAVIEPNQYINEATLVSEGTESATFQVIESAIVLFLSRVAFYATLQRYPMMRQYIPLPLAPVGATGQPGAAPQQSSVQQSPIPQSPLQQSPIQKRPLPQHATQESVMQQRYAQSSLGSAPQGSPYPSGGPVGQRPAATVSPASPNTPFSTGASPAATSLLRSGEKLLLQTRRHWWAYIRQSWIPLVVGIIMLLVAFAVPSDGLRVLLLTGTLLVPGALLLYFYLEWRNDQLIVTTDRVLRIERTIITFRSWTNEVPIRSIQQVNTEIPAYDVFARIFNYGEIVLKTAGKAGTVKLNFIPDAERVQDMIFELLNNSQQNMEQRRDGQIRDDIQRVLGNLPPEEDRKITPVVQPTERGFLQTRFINAQGATVYRKHWLFWLRSVMTPLLLLGGSVIAILLFLAVPGLNTLGIVAYPAAGLAFVVGGLWLYWADWDWRNDVYIVGDDTISIIHRRPLWLQNEDDRILINRIDNVIVEISGILRSAFNYGDVKLALIGDSGTKIFKDVPSPRAVQNEISARQQRVKGAAAEAEEKRRREEIARYIAAYDEARGAGQAAQINPQGMQQGFAPAQSPDQIPRAAPTAGPRYGAGIPNARPNPHSAPNANQGPSGRRLPPNQR